MVSHLVFCIFLAGLFLAFARSAPKSSLSSLLNIHGGFTQSDNNGGVTQLNKATLNPIDALSTPPQGPVNVIVTTSIGSEFLDKKKKLTMPGNATILELKQLIHNKFPGSPPTALQSLFFGDRPLLDEDLVRNVSRLPTVPIFLDMISGSSAYNRTLSVKNTVEAFAASQIHITYLNEAVSELASPMERSIKSNKEMRTRRYRELLSAVNETLFASYNHDIELALQDESEPEYSSADTSVWRVKGKRRIGSLAGAISREFDLTARGFRQLVIYSAILVVIAMYGNPMQQPGEPSLILGLIPMLWLSKLRGFRLLSKVCYQFSYIISVLLIVCAGGVDGAVCVAADNKRDRFLYASPISSITGQSSF